MPKLLTQGNLQCRKPAGLWLEWWPASYRNGGRCLIGMAAGFTSESAGSARGLDNFHAMWSPCSPALAGLIGARPLAGRSIR